MNYKVIWKKVAEKQLAEIWVRSHDRSRIVAVADRIVSSLGSNPEDLGESRTGGDRVIIESPLAVTYRIDERSKTVLILKIHAFERRSSS